jgi:hypothetical protein
MRTIYIKSKWGKILKLENFPNAGPYPSISGMKKLYWGKNAYVIKCGTYAYKVDEKTYKHAEALEGR